MKCKLYVWQFSEPFVLFDIDLNRFVNATLNPFVSFFSRNLLIFTIGVIPGDLARTSVKTFLKVLY